MSDGDDYTARVIADAPGLAGFMEEVAKLFKNSGGVNYLEMQFGLKDDALGPLTITIQRSEGKTPDQLRKEADATSDRLMRGLAFFKSVIQSGEKWTQYCQDMYDALMERDR